MGRVRPGSPRLKDRHTVNSNHLQFFYPIACPSPHGVRAARHAAGTAQPAKQGCGQLSGLNHLPAVHTPVISMNRLFPTSPVHVLSPPCHCFLCHCDIIPSFIGEEYLPSDVAIPASHRSWQSLYSSEALQSPPHSLAGRRKDHSNHFVFNRCQ